MSQEQVLKTLVGLGLTRLDSQVYIHLAKRGPQKGQDLSKGLKVQKQQLYRSLRNLQSKGIVNATLEHPARFNAVSFDKVVDIFIKTKMAEAQHIQEQKTAILANWQAINLGETVDATAKFNVIEGRGPVYAKILQMMNETKNQLSTISTINSLVRADQFGLFKNGIENQLKPRIKFRALTELSEENLGVTKKFLKELANAKTNFEGRTPDLSLTLPQMVLRDEEEILFFITPKTGIQPAEQEDVCLWTNCQSLVQAFTTVFEDFWRNSINIDLKIKELETGKTAPKTHIIDDANKARKRYNEAVSDAEKEVTMITSSEGLTEIWKNKQLLNNWNEKNIAVRIMAPITSINVEAAQKLLKYGEVRHAPFEYLGTTIIDGEHLFQFKNAPPNQETDEPTSLFENTFYTNDREYVHKTQLMLNDVWKNAQTPSTATLEAINKTNAQKLAADSFNALAVTDGKIYGPKVIGNEQTSRITEKEILDRIINPDRHQTENKSNTVTTYGINVQAIVHPPSNLGLPNLLFHCFHFEEHSTYGEGDAMLIHLWLKTPVGYSYVPEAYILNNVKSAGFWRKFLANLPVEKNVRVVKKNELQVRVHGNTAIIAWTIPISIPPYTLPPCCIIAEGTGNMKAGSYTIVAPSGYRQIATYNACDAFITFLHPSSKYSGPGTDGVFGRDSIMEIFPPETSKPEKFTKKTE